MKKQTKEELFAASQGGEEGWIGYGVVSLIAKVRKRFKKRKSNE
jgi:hypothetical protein